MNNCNLCGKTKLLPLLSLGDHPIAHRFLSNPGEKEYVHPVDVCFCENCGLIQIVNPIPPGKLYTNYNWLSSWKWNPHIPILVKLIEQKFGVSKKMAKIVEVGCNDGNFLDELRKEGYANLLGVEPSKDGREASRQKGIKTIGSYFNKKTASEIVKTQGRCDLFISRQMLEHIIDLREFQEALSIVLRPGGYVLFEVPNFGLGLSSPDYSAIWEEHVNYFTLQTLKRFLFDAGVRVIHSETAVFSGEALIVLGEYVKPSKSKSFVEELETLRSKALAFRNRWPNLREEFIGFLKNYKEHGRKVAIYGAGCRACSLVNYTGIAPYLELCLDDQAEKQGKYLPGARIPILSGDELERRSIDLCLLAVNAENEEAVIARHLKFQENGGKFASIHPPSKRLLPFLNYP